VRIGGTGRLRGQSFELSNNLGCDQSKSWSSVRRTSVVCLTFLVLPAGANRKGDQGRGQSVIRCFTFATAQIPGHFCVSVHGPGCFCFELAFVRQCATADRVSASITHAYHARSVCGLGKTSLDGCLEPAVVIGLTLSSVLYRRRAGH
jgi:hypothetical protein